MNRVGPGPCLRSLVRTGNMMVIWLALAVPVVRSDEIRNMSGIPEQHDPRPVTVADVIQMTQFGEFAYLRGVSAKYNPAHFSPDGKHFVIVTTRGNIEKNSNDYSLLLFQTETALRSPAPEVLVSISSPSNRTGIEDISWVNNRTIAFRGETPGDLKQVYEIDCETLLITKLTNQSTDVTAYAFTHDGDKLFFLAYRRATPLLDDKANRNGVVVSTQLLSDLIAGEDRQGDHFPIMDLFMKAATQSANAPVQIEGDYKGALWPSPNGLYLIVETPVVDIPKTWEDYQDFWLQTHIRSTNRERGSVLQYRLLDIVSQQTEALLDAPTGGDVCISGSVMWSLDSNSVVVSGTYLPLDVPDPADRKRRQSTKMFAEIKIPSLEIVPISSREVCPLKWDHHSGKLLTGLTHYVTQVFSYGDLLAFQKGAAGWKEVEVPPSSLAENGHIDITLEEDMNTPPKLFARDLNTGHRAVLLDFNPQFKDLKFGRVQNVTFEATDGRRVHAGLYLPPDFVPGNKYPLVIQTHGWDPDRFWIDGIYPSASAAQPLASRGFVVLQVNEGSTVATPEEYQQKTSAYEGAIDYLDHLGIVDRDRVGIVGFSRTGLGVEFALTHSQYHFAAATLADHSDGGYFIYLSLLPTWSWWAPDYESINGGMPFGDGLASWAKNSPSFNLTKVSTPVREEAYTPISLLGAWEWFAGLSRLAKPVDLIYITGGDHVLVKPWDRMISQQGNVDWFSFWLQGYEDPNPTKSQQYKRWRELRKLQEHNTQSR